MKAWRIIHYDRVHSNAESRRIRKCSWVAVPNRHDSAGLRRLMRRPDGMAIYAAYLLMVQVTSQLAPEYRGWLINADLQPLDASDMADRTGGDESIFSRAFELLASDKIQWLSFDEIPSADSRACPEKSVREGREGERRGVGVGVGVTESVELRPPTPTPTPDASHQGLRAKRTRQQVAIVDRFLEGLFERWPALADERGNWAALGYRLTELPRSRANELSKTIMREARRLSASRSPPSALQVFANGLLCAGNADAKSGILSPEEPRAAPLVQRA